MAYEIVDRLKTLNENNILETLSKGVQFKERMRGKLHQVFRLSFDAKELRTDIEIINVLEYIHHNPVKGKWNLVEHYIDYPYSSAKFYEKGIDNYIKIVDFRNVFSESSASD